MPKMTEVRIPSECIQVQGEQSCEIRLIPVSTEIQFEKKETGPWRANYFTDFLHRGLSIQENKQEVKNRLEEKPTECIHSL